MKIVFIISLLCLITSNSTAQSVAINTDGSTAAASAMLDIKSTAKGLLIPRMSKTQRNAIVSPSTGLLVYQNAPDSNGFYFFDGVSWNWLADNKKNDTSYWGLHGNYNTHPPAGANNMPIDFNNDTYLGTFEPKDVSMLAGGNELIRLKQFSTGGRIGLSNRNPEYSIDLRITEINNETQIQGLRIISKDLFDIFSSSNINKGLVIGNNPTNINDMVIWNHANNIDGSLRFGLDNYNNTIRPAFSITGGGQGIHQKNPIYLLDIHSLSQFAAANTTPTNKNGIRISYPNQENANNMERGLFMGVGINGNLNSYIWNYADGTGGNSPTKAIYFGVGGDMNLSNQPATMELQEGKITLGRLTDPNFFFPSSLNIQTNYASSVAKNGISIMQQASNNESAYFGVDDNNNLTIQKFGTGNIYLGSNTTNHISILPNGNVGIGVISPSEKLEVIGKTKTTNLQVTNGAAIGKVLTSDAVGNANWADVPTTATFWAASGNNIYNTNTGNVGIGTSNPLKQTEIIGVASATPVTLVIGNRGGFGPAAMEFVSDYGTGSQWRPGYIRSNDVGGFTGAVEIYTNGTGASNLYGSIKGLEVRNGVTYTATGTVSSWSDARLKKSVYPFTSGLDIINQINPVSFYYNRQSPFQTEKMQIGILAQDLEKVAPYMVDKHVTKGFNDLRSVNNQAYIFLLINAVKDQQKQIEELKQQVQLLLKK